MKKTDVEAYRKHLVAERERIQKALEEIEAEIGRQDEPGGHSELADYDNHPADAGTDTFEKEKNLAVRDNYREILGRMEDALAKMDRGTYGECDRCGRAIAKGRLDAIPYAIYCVECQEIIDGR